MKFFKNISPSFWVLLAGCLIIILVSVSRLFNSFELLTYDLRFNLRPPQQVSDDIVIVDIDDDTLKNLGRWPLPRDFHASLVNVLNESGAKSIVFDLLFTESTAHDDDLAASIKNAGSVYLSQALYIADPRGARRFFSEDHPVLADVTPVLKQNARSVGHINVIIDPDGKTRRVPLFIKQADGLLPQMALRAACDWLGLNSQEVEMKGDKIIIDHQLELPLSSDGAFMVNFPGKWSDSFRHFSYINILQSYLAMKQGKSPALDLSAINGKICFIGLTATGTSDLRATPLENIYPMLGLQASVFNSIVRRSFIRDAGVIINTVIGLLIFLLSLLICLRLSPLRSFLGSVAAGIVYFGAAVLLFIFQGIWVDLFFPLFVIILTYVASTGYRFFDEIKKRQIMEKELEIAQAIQKSFLPRDRDLAGIPGVSIAASLQPAKFVAGDLYDVVRVDDKKIGIFIGDVAGKGASASLVMAQAISLFRIFSRQSGECKDVLTRLNQELYGRLGGRFVTALYVVVDLEKKILWAASAGHGPLLVSRPGEEKTIDVKLDGNVPLGMMEGVNYQSVSFNFEGQDKIIIFSDGLLEARNKDGEEFGLDKINRIIQQNALNSSQKTLEALNKSVTEFAFPATQYDDITIVILSAVKTD